MASGADGGADVLLQRPWLPVTISGHRLLNKSWFRDSGYELLLTDLRSVWRERMEAAAIHRRAQELNRRLRAPVEAFFSHLCEVVQPCLMGGGEAQVSLSREDRGGGVSLRVKSELAGLPFFWEFHCSPAPVTLACDQLVRPLLAMSRLLQQQVEQLEVLLVRKDSEIQDYRENGATLSRERLQTDVYEQQRYREDFMMKALPGLTSGQHDSQGFSADLQQLYAAVVAHGNVGKRKLLEEKEQLSAEEPDHAAVSGHGSNGSQSAERSTQSAETSTQSAERSTQSAERSGEKTRKEAPGSKMADRATTQQTLVSSDPAEQTSSKPKKKKVGLFR